MNNTAQYKEKLESMLKAIKAELSTIAVYNHEQDDWDVTTDSADNDDADINAQADAVEEADEKIAILASLETRYRNIKRALAKIETGDFGICEISGEPIEAKRLEANPAARTCIAHLDEEAFLPL